MTDMELLFAVTGLILLSGLFLTFSWHKFIVSRRASKDSADNQ
jgi:hypothetical protein